MATTVFEVCVNHLFIFLFSIILCNMITIFKKSYMIVTITHPVFNTGIRTQHIMIISLRLYPLDRLRKRVK